MTKLFVLTAIMLTVALMPMLSLANEPAGNATIKPAASFENIKDGDTVTSPVHIRFNVVGMEVAPVGTDKPNTGHFHLLIDTELTGDALKTAIPADAQHKHYGKGQTEDDVTLTPGKHTLQLVMGDGNHVPHNPPVMSGKITVTVK